MLVAGKCLNAHAQGQLEDWSELLRMNYFRVTYVIFLKRDGHSN